MRDTIRRWYPAGLLAAALLMSALAYPELPERVALSDRGGAERLMARLGEFGCRYTLDDFGAGTAALRYLEQMPVEFLKLDGRLTRSMPFDAAGRARLGLALFSEGRVVQVGAGAREVEAS